MDAIASSECCTEGESIRAQLQAQVNERYFLDAIISPSSRLPEEQKRELMNLHKKDLAHEVADHILSCGCLDDALEYDEDGYSLRIVIFSQARWERILQIAQAKGRELYTKVN